MIQKVKFVSFLFVLGLISLCVGRMTASGEGIERAPFEDPVLFWQHHAPPPPIQDFAFEGVYVWVATYDGVVRWNRTNQSYQRYTTADGLADNQVLSVAVDNAGNKWFGTDDGGVSRFDGSQWTTYTAAQGLTSNFVPTIVIHPNGNVLLGTGGGVNVFDGNTISGLPVGGPSNHVTGIAVDQSQRIWVGTYDFGTFVLTGNQWQHYGNPEVGPGGQVRDVAVAPSGDIWFAFEDHQYGGVGRFSNGNWIRYSTADGLVNNYAQELAFDAGGQLWVAFSDYSLGGVGLFDGNNWSQLNVSQVTGIALPGITDLGHDPDGQLWFASYTAHLLNFDGNQWNVYLTGLPMPQSVGIAHVGIAPNGNVWFSVPRAGVVRYNGASWQMYTKAHGLTETGIQDIEVDLDGNIWFVTWVESGGPGAGVDRFNGPTWTHYSTANGLADERAYDITVDGAGNVWIGTFNGLSKFDGSNWTTYTTADGLESNRIQRLAVHGNDLWIVYGEAVGGITRYDGANWTTYTTADGFPEGISLIDFDSTGNLWVATASGVSHYNGSTWDSYPLPDGSPLGWITDMVVDGGDSVWIGANGNNWTGLSRLTNGVWTSYTTADGLLSDEIDDIAVNTAGTQLWFSEADEGVGTVYTLYGLNEKLHLPFVSRD